MARDLFLDHVGLPDAGRAGVYMQAAVQKAVGYHHLSALQQLNIHASHLYQSKACA